MGVILSGAKLLIAARASGVCYRRAATIGRQNLYVDYSWYRRLLSDNRCVVGERDEEAVRASHTPYIERFLGLLGAESVDSIDASDYEGATIVHDMNVPVPDELKGRYDVVIDFGSLEHIFNFPIALRNYMEMLRVGGHLIINVPGNNYMGHGFYQFSPELFHRVLSPSNGFAVERMLAYEEFTDSQWYEVVDPAAVRSRVELTNSLPVELFIQARKVCDRPLFESPPQQSDYKLLWSDRPASPPATSPGSRNEGPHPAVVSLKNGVTRLAPGLVRRLRASIHAIRWRRRRTTTFKNTRFYKPVRD